MRTARVIDSLSLPRPSATMLRWFHWYTRRYLRKHVNSIRVAGLENVASVADRPLIVCLNHPSWWDPLICAFLANTLFPTRRHFAPIDADALKQYSFFKRLGFFGVEKDSHRGARQFLETSLALLRQSDTALWITVQGRFADVRERPFRLMPGVAHLLAKSSDCYVLPVAMEVVHWEERRPEIVVRLGEVLDSSSGNRTTEDWTKLLSATMENTLDKLAADSIARNSSAFQVLLGGEAGVGGVYDRWRALKARLRGERFDPHHSREAA